MADRKWLEGFAHRIRERRFELGMTQQQVADLAGMSQGQVCNYENAVSEPFVSSAAKLAAALEVDGNWMLGEVGGDD